MPLPSSPLPNDADKDAKKKKKKKKTTHPVRASGRTVLPDEAKVELVIVFIAPVVRYVVQLEIVDKRHGNCMYVGSRGSWRRGDQQNRLNFSLLDIMLLCDLSLS